jgi:PDZ domain-containing protein
MTRRSATLAVAGALLVALIAVASLLPVPYVVYSPGPVEDTLGEWEGEPVIEIAGAETYPTEGILDLTTVGVTPADRKLDLFSALRAWVDNDRAVVPRGLVYPEDITAEESREANAQLLERSQETAKVAALRKTGHEVPETVVVDSVLEGAPADGVLKPGDVVVSVDGTVIETPQDVVDAVRAHSPGESVEFVLRRDGRDLTETIRTEAAEDDGRAIVGFSPAVGYEFPIEVDVNIDERIGGPSAGMIFALAIYDTLTPGALLDGMHIAGTGEISAAGEVGPIGGIQQKIAAAAEDGATLFLAPTDNCDEAVHSNNGGMRVVPIATLDDAIAAVEAAVAGEDGALPACTVS